MIHRALGTVVLLMLFTFSASAKIMYMDVYDPTIMGYSGPVVTKCIAYSAQGQRCRVCMDNYDMKTGALIGKVCAYYDSHGGCQCDKQACTTQTGTCDYK